VRLVILRNQSTTALPLSMARLYRHMVHRVNRVVCRA
jgi:hypothetical protein